MVSALVLFVNSRAKQIPQTMLQMNQSCMRLISGAFFTDKHFNQGNSPTVVYWLLASGKGKLSGENGLKKAC